MNQDHPAEASASPVPHFHTQTAQQAAQALQVDLAAGLSSEEAVRRLTEHGPNRLPVKPPRSPWLLFLDQFKNLLIVVLAAAAVLAGIIGDVKNAVVILIVILFNATLGFYQEHRAEAALAALKKMLAPAARVRRDGSPWEIPAEDLAPGDIVLLESGDRVPADGRIVVAHQAEIDESTLTGESHPVVKTAHALTEVEIPLADRVNLAFMNTIVTWGRLELLITTTGAATEMGRLATMLEQAEEGPTPLQLQLDVLGKRLALIAGMVVALIFIVDMLRGRELVEIALTSIALAVAAIPEGLPAVVTVTLALGMQRMAKKRAIVKRLAAVETLGCTTVICSDKTGTLTLNQMTARALFFQGHRFAVEGEGYSGQGVIKTEYGAGLPDFSALYQSALLCNDSRIVEGQLIGDPTEGALLALGVKAGGELASVTARLPRRASRNSRPLAVSR